MNSKCDPLEEDTRYAALALETIDRIISASFEARVEVRAKERLSYDVQIRQPANYRNIPANLAVAIVVT